MISDCAKVLEQGKKKGGGGAAAVLKNFGYDPSFRRVFHKIFLWYMSNSASYRAAWSSRVLQALFDAIARPARCLLAATWLCTLCSLWKNMYRAAIMATAAVSGG